MLILFVFDLGISAHWVVLQTLNFLRSLPERHGKPLSKVIPDANIKGMYRSYGETAWKY